MSNNSFIHKLIYRFGVWITPIALIFISIFINLPNADLHKQTLRNSNFYTDLSSEIRSTDLSVQDINRGFGSILLRAVLSDLATPGWLQNFFEQNIDLIAKWLTDQNQESNLILFIPSQEIELAVAKRINKTTAEVSDKFSDQIPVCSRDEVSKLKREGFSFEQSFCLPERVKNGEQELLEFLEINQEDIDRGRVLDKVINNNILNNFNENFRADQILSLDPVQKQFLNFLNQIRSTFLWLRSLFLPTLILIILLFVVNLILAKFTDNKKISYEIRRYFYTVAIGTITSSILIILFLGGFIYLNGWVQSIFIPGLNSSIITNLLALEMVKFAFNLVSLAVWISLGMIAFNIIFKILEITGILSDIKKKNQKLQMATSSVDKNPTLDGEFQRIRREQEKQARLNSFENPSYENPNFSNPNNPAEEVNFFQGSGNRVPSQQDVQYQRINDFGSKYPINNNGLLNPNQDINNQPPTSTNN